MDFKHQWNKLNHNFNTLYLMPIIEHRKFIHSFKLLKVVRKQVAVKLNKNFIKWTKNNKIRRYIYIGSLELIYKHKAAFKITTRYERRYFIVSHNSMDPSY